MDCRELKAMMDSYISDELLIETNHEVLRHLENCAACRGEMAARRSLKTQLRNAVKSSDEMQIDLVFYSRTAATLKDTALRPDSWERLTSGFLTTRLLTVGVTCLFLISVGSIIWLTRTQDKAFNASNTSTDIAKVVLAPWAGMTKLAVGDHENCAVEYNLKEDPITLDEAATKFGAYNKDMDKVAMAAFKAEPQVSADTEFIESHSCIYEGRRFAHIVVRHKGRVVSLLVTDTDLAPGNDEVQTAKVGDSLSAAGFLAGGHAVFVVSQLAETENATLAKAVAPAIRLHIGKQGA